MIAEQQTRRFLQHAQKVAERSNCVRAKVGAVLVGYDDELQWFEQFHIGWNRLRPWLKESQTCRADCPRGQKSFEEQPAYAPYTDCIYMHAEIAAMLSAGWGMLARNLHWFMFVTRRPCDRCAITLKEHEVKAIWIDSNGILQGLSQANQI